MTNHNMDKKGCIGLMRNGLLPIVSMALLVGTIFSNAVFGTQHTEIIVKNAYARESIPGTTISSAYMTLDNSSAKAKRLISAKSLVSDRIEIHEHTMADGLMRMRQRQQVEILANSQVTFKPSGLHLMMFDLKRPLKAKENIIISLYFDDLSRVDVNYTVQGLKQKKHQHH